MARTYGSRINADFASPDLAGEEQLMREHNRTVITSQARWPSTLAVSHIPAKYG
jgi:hypothetical protein